MGNVKKEKQEIARRTFYDSIKEEEVIFWSDASPKLVNALEFNAAWYVVKEILLDWGYKVIEHPVNN